MKTTFKYITAAFAVCAALVSCQKENYSDKNDDNPAVGNVRVIEAHFSAATKSTLGGENGRTPLFVNRDKIMASNGTSKEECTVSVDNEGVATFATSLTGALTAVYPSDAAKMNDNGIDIDGVIVPAIQDGTFAKANIAKATIASDATSATFENQTSLLRFYVDESIGVKSITITATGEANIADGSTTITVDPEGDDTLDKVTVDNPDKRICYIAVLPGTFTLTFTTVTTTQKIYADNTVERIAGNVTLASSTIYNAFIPYYIDLEDAGKWGYCNVGAFLPEEPGEYFAWGETTGHKPDKKSGVFDEESGVWEGAFTFGVDNGGFATNFSNCPYCTTPGDDGESPFEPRFSKYSFSGYNYEEFWGGTGEPDNLTVLESCDDAATANWGNGWRMPVYDEFIKLYKACNETYDTETYASEACGGATTFNQGAYWCENYEEVAGCLFCDGINKLFFPAAGFGEDTYFVWEGYNGGYWSSSLQDAGPAYARYLEFYPQKDINLEKGGYLRYCGYSIRPILNTAPAISYNTPEQYERDNW